MKIYQNPDPDLGKLDSGYPVFQKTGFRISGFPSKSGRIQISSTALKISPYWNRQKRKKWTKMLDFSKFCPKGVIYLVTMFWDHIKKYIFWPDLWLNQNGPWYQDFFFLARWTYHVSSSGPSLIIQDLKKTCAPRRKKKNIVQFFSRVNFFCCKHSIFLLTSITVDLLLKILFLEEKIQTWESFGKALAIWPRKEIWKILKHC